MVDQEGGRVARLRAPFWPDLPAAATLKTAGDAFAHGQKLGQMASAAGFDVVAAPVLDVRHPGADDVIGDRAISDDPKIVAEFGGRIAAGILEAGVTPVVKHMPGHGRAMVDSHKALPRVSATDLDDDFYPFAKNAALPWGMTAHIVFESIDPSRPATLSPVVIRDVIRGKIGFLGTLVSDDLAMGALTGTPAERVLAALAAGCDIALYCTGDLSENLSILRALDG
jgi:beta-N-acetylhexosaminidase